MDIAELRSSLEAMLIRVCDLEAIGVSEIDHDERLIGGRLDLNSLDSIEIAAAIEYEYGVRMQDLSVAKKAFRTVRSLAEHIAREKGWPT